MTGLTGDGEGRGVVRAAVVQAAPVAFDVDATLAKVERLTA
jgi:predicted amidohydrolase